MMTPEMEEKFRNITFGIPWNLALLTFGSWLIAFAVKAIAMPHGLLTGGMSGLALLVYYVVGGLSAGQWYFALNIPVFVLGWVFISRKFFFYSLYGMFASGMFIDLIDYTMPINDIWLAVVTCGGILGMGVGITLRTLGSTGGADILAVICKQKFNMSMGTFEFWFNIIVYIGGFAYLDMHVMLYSIAMTFVIAIGIDYIVNLFGERKMVMVISKHSDDIKELVLHKLDRGCTLFNATGGWTGEPKKVLLTMVSNIQLKQLEELVHSVDPDAFVIMGSNFSVVGHGFSSRPVK